MHCDKHVVKMIVEYAQLLSTAHRVLDGTQVIVKQNNRNVKRWLLKGKKEIELYKATHINHPSAIWVRETSENYNYLYNLFVELCNEYKFRYGKIHSTSRLIDILKYSPTNIKLYSMTEVPQAMPDYCRIQGDSISAYRNYYIKEKQHILKYKNRGIPVFLK